MRLAAPRQCRHEKMQRGSILIFDRRVESIVHQLLKRRNVHCAVQALIEMRQPAEGDEVL